MPPMSPASPGDRSFAPTRWTLVRRAAPGGAAAVDALAELYGVYWPPLYAYLRRQGSSPEDAADLVQALFFRLVEAGGIGAADPRRGRFRNYLIGALEHVRSHAAEREAARKRGGDRTRVAFDFAAEEARVLRGPAGAESPERAFERRWATALLAHAVDGLAADYAARGKAELFAALKPLLVADGAAEDQAQLAARLGMTPGALRVALHRLRDRYREAVRAAVAATVDSDAEIDEELAALRRALQTDR
jgi:RNA polymerase sigma-70 factor (ECF subfamily)